MSTPSVFLWCLFIRFLHSEVDIAEIIDRVILLEQLLFLIQTIPLNLPVGTSCYLDNMRLERTKNSQKVFKGINILLIQPNKMYLYCCCLLLILNFPLFFLCAVWEEDARGFHLFCIVLCMCNRYNNI